MSTIPIELTLMSEQGTRPRRARLGIRAMLLGLFLPFFLPISPLAERLVWNPLMDLAHVPAFALATVLVSLLVERSLFEDLASTRYRRAILAAAILALCAVFLAELVQPYLGRSASVRDARNGVFGVLIAGTGTWLLAFSRRYRPVPRATRRGWLLGGLWLVWSLASFALVSYAAMPFVESVRAQRFRDSSFPVLGDFEDPLELTLWVPAGSREGRRNERTFVRSHSAHGKQALEIRPVGTMGGVIFRAGERDWSEHAFLEFELWSPVQARLGLRVDDQRGGRSFEERYEAEFPVSAGDNRYRIPLAAVRNQPRSGPLNLQSIRRMVVYFIEAPDGVRFVLDHVRLSR